MRKTESFAVLRPVESHKSNFGRGDRIRTCDPLRPRQVRYQAALHPDRCHDYRTLPDEVRTRRAARLEVTGA